MTTSLDFSKAIETNYNGILFRSRTEARIALLLDLFKIEWSYEPEGFDVSGRWYLPDFYLPLYDAFWEVKAFDSQVDESARDLFISFSSQIQKPLILSIGSPRLGVQEPDEDGGGRPYNGFSLRIIAGQYWEKWPYSQLFATAFDLSKYLQKFAEENLPTFIHGAWWQTPKSFQEAVEMDKVYFLSRYGRSHPKYEYGRCADVDLSSHKGEAFFNLDTESLTDKFSWEIYDKVSSYRFSSSRANK
jgi:hypothetical protein